jgi:hypothetical protein
VAILACWLLLSLVAVARLVRGGHGLPIVALGAALLGLGVLPLILIINRPEQLLRLLLTLLLFAPFVLRRSRPGLVGGVVRALAIVFTATLLFAHHPKSVYFVPLVLASAWYVVPGVAIRSLTATAVVFFAWRATGHWYDRLRCPEDPWVQTFIEQKMLHPSKLVPGLGRATALSALSALRDNVLRSSRYVSETFIGGVYNGSWLPRSESPPFAPAVNAAVAIVWIGVALLAVWTLWRLAAGVVRMRRLPLRTVMVFALSLPLAGLALLEGHKAFYESGLVLPFLGFVPALGLRCRRVGKGAGVVRALGATVLAVSLASMVTLWATVLPLLPAWLSRGYVPKQRLSISAFGAADARDQVRIAARLCGIDPSRTMDHLVVDSLTYTTFDNLRQPYFALYTFDHSKDDVLDLLAARGSAGMVVSCGAVPRSLLRRTRRFGPLCCLPPFVGQAADTAPGAPVRP